ncbi:MAG: PIN domain-containing protein [Pseudomonadota bacterium]
MKALDTNVLISWLLNEGVREELTDDAYHIGTVALAELAWVMRTSFGKSRQEITRTLNQILEMPMLRFDDKQTVVRAVSDFNDLPADFPDYLLMHGNLRQGCEITLTFDKKASRADGFQLLNKG